MKKFSWIERNENLKKLKSEIFDVCIIGGGITGAGVARDAALRGLKVVLIESNDFASGTSSRSSKLIHGGIRYLENYEFHLVFEALSERSKLFEMAPHLVHPLRFLIPLYESSRVPPWKMNLGLWLYDALALFRTPEMHQMLSPEETKSMIPILKSDALNAAFIYSDAYMDDDRLVHETLRSANEAGATILNYVKAQDLIKDTSGTAQALKYQDQLNHETGQIKFRQIVSTVGPWTDIVGHNNNSKWKSILRPTKGIHLTFRKEDFPLPNAVVMAAEERIVFAIPRHEMVIVGTTDTDFSGDPSKVRVDASDVAYILSVVKKYFPFLEISESQIVSSYAGVRPLVNDGSSTEGKVSREHTIFRDETNTIYAAGGKYTTYRKMSEDIVEVLLSKMNIEQKSKLSKCQTQTSLNPLVPPDVHLYAAQVKCELTDKFQIDSETCKKLFERHGLEAIKIVDNFHRRYGRPGTWIEFEAFQALETTMCLNTLDFITRRVPQFLSQKDHGRSDLLKVMPLFADYLSWMPADLQKEEQRFNEYVAAEFSWKK